MPVRTARAAVLTFALALLTAGWACEAPPEGPARFAQAVEALDPDLAAWSALRLGDDARAVLTYREAHAVPNAEGNPEPPPWEALARAYDTPWEEAVQDGGAGPSDAALRRWQRAAAERVRPYAILVEEEGDEGRLAFLGAYWTSPVIDRLRVVRPPGDGSVATTPGAILDALETCAVEVEEWIVGGPALARRLLSASDGPTMLVVGRRQEGGMVRAWIGPDEVLAALQFEHPATRELTSFSAWFSGSGPGPVALARALPGVRSSMGPRALLRLVRGIR
ncbi:MAG: hypothetical protein U5K81_07850 [Trueperaceae bacterium]|nr:hypothetical protein [Trueperaceae bacterium]